MTRVAPPRVREEPAGGELPLWTHPGWAQRWPWLVQGTTGRGEPAAPFDLGLGGDAPVGAVLGRWRALRRETRMRSVAHARQVHGAEVHVHDASCAAGLLILEGCDGHLTDVPGILLAISVADCVPVFLVDTERRAIALVHAGWRGVAAGILERAVERVRARYGSAADALQLHLGPAICGRCYEVGPEVVAALGGAETELPGHVDLRAALTVRAAAAGVSFDAITVSDHCTRCGVDGADAARRAFFSHRAGEPGRQMAVLGIRSEA